jgi:nucleotide-binding universal stress UspA family protein
MEKNIVFVNSTQAGMSALDMACYLAKLTHSRLTGLFVQDIPFALIPSFHIQKPYFRKHTDRSAGQDTALKMDVTQAISLFKASCNRREVNCDACEVKGDPVEEVVNESRFADLLVMDPKTTFSERPEGMPSHFVREVMEHAECPVVITPEAFEGIEEICFCYDGTRSSVYAMKQFSYLFPQYQFRKATLLEIKKAGAKPKNEEDKKALSWISRHYNFEDAHIVRGDVKRGFLSYFLQKKNTFIVMGAYGRNALSYLFKKSSADMLFRILDLPLFIAHH